MAETGQPYAYTGDDPVNGVDPLGLWGWNPISDAEQAASDVNHDADDVGHFLKDPNRWRAEADYLASVGNGIVSTVTLGHVHIAAPYCGYGLASDLGDAIGTALTIVVGGDLGGAVDVLRGAETVEEAEATADVEQSINEGNYIVKTSEGTYVGQSGDISSRLAAHVANDKFTQAEVDVAERIFVGGGKTAREIAEQRLIDGLGGVDSPDVLNIRNPIGQTRIGLMGPGYIRP